MLDLKITDVRTLPGDSAFLIDDGKTSILYDSGFAFTGYAVAEKINRELDGRKLDYIFLTHSHYDHALGSAYALKYWPGAKVVAGEYAAKIFKKDSAKAVMRDLDKKFSYASGIIDYDDLIDNLRVDIEVADGDKILAGDMEFTAIHLPGHTRCSVGYYCRDKKLLLGCETIGVYGGEDIVVPSYLVGYKMTMESIEKVKLLDIEYILTPHYGILDKEQAKAYVVNAEKNAKEVALTISNMAKRGCGKSEIFDYFKEKFYHGYVESIYPVDAMEMNTNIMIDLIKKEL
ncbi:MAG: MBL fold metallo-hydrolase [Clostridia bacterium]|nr:MBL fold metallo-hydrolase [Clostridia bacterium]